MSCGVPMYMPLEIKELPFPLKISDADEISNTAIALLVASKETYATVSRLPKPPGVVLTCRKNPAPEVVGAGLLVDELEVDEPVVNEVVMVGLLVDELVVDELEVDELAVDEIEVDEVGVTGPPVDKLVVDELWVYELVLGVAEPITV